MPGAWPVGEDGYAIAWTAPARRAPGRLPEKTARAVAEFWYRTLAASPHRAAKPLKLGPEGLHSTGRGDYRLTGPRDMAAICA